MNERKRERIKERERERERERRECEFLCFAYKGLSNHTFHLRVSERESFFGSVLKRKWKGKMSPYKTTARTLTSKRKVIKIS